MTAGGSRMEANLHSPYLTAREDPENSSRRDREPPHRVVIEWTIYRELIPSS